MEAETRDLPERREKVASAGGELLGAALNLVGELIDTGTSPDPATIDQVRTGLDNCVARDDTGRPQLRITLPNDEALNTLATSLARLLVAQNE